MQKGFPVATTPGRWWSSRSPCGRAHPRSRSRCIRTVYDVVPGEVQRVRRPDVVILEGVNVLQAAPVTDPPASMRWPPTSWAPTRLHAAVQRPAGTADSSSCSTTSTRRSTWTPRMRTSSAGSPSARHPAPSGPRGRTSSSTASSPASATRSPTAARALERDQPGQSREHIAPTRSRAQVVIEKARFTACAGCWSATPEAPGVIGRAADHDARRGRPGGHPREHRTPRRPAPHPAQLPDPGPDRTDRHCTTTAVGRASAPRSGAPTGLGWRWVSVRSAARARACRS